MTGLIDRIHHKAYISALDSVSIDTNSMIGETRDPPSSLTGCVPRYALHLLHVSASSGGVVRSNLLLLKGKQEGIK